MPEERLLLTRLLHGIKLLRWISDDMHRFTMVAVLLLALGLQYRLMFAPENTNDKEPCRVGAAIPAHPRGKTRTYRRTNSTVR